MTPTNPHTPIPVHFRPPTPLEWASTILTHHDIAITEEGMSTILYYLQHNDPDTYSRLTSQFSPLVLTKPILNTIGYLVVGRSWPSSEEGDAVLAGFIRRLNVHCRNHGVRLGETWMKMATKADRFMRTRGMGHL